MAAKKTANVDPTGYADAMREVETILSELDSNNIDVDVLASKVERAQDALSREDGLPVCITVLFAQFLPVTGLVPG